MTTPADRTDRPSLAERARTAVAAASAVTLVTGRCGSRTLTVVGLDEARGGCPVLRLEPDSPLVRALASCPVATLSFATGEPDAAFGLTGTLERLRGAASGPADGLVRFALSPLSARFHGAQSRPVPLADYLAAEPDPVAPHAAEVVQHLESAHADRVLAAVRARVDPLAAAAVPRSLDRYALEVAVVTVTGVGTTRMALPGAPASSLAEAGRALHELLTCTCSSSHPSRRPGTGADTVTETGTETGTDPRTRPSSPHRDGSRES